MVEKIFMFLILLVAIKALIGYNFPWETCQCCGKKYKEHKLGSP